VNINISITNREADQNLDIFIGANLT